MLLKVIIFILLFFVGNVSAQYKIDEFIFDNVTNSPDVPNQGMDMHSFYDGKYVWYPYFEYSDSNHISKLIKFNPVDDSLEIIALEIPTSPDIGVPYQAIQSVADVNIVWIYSAYQTRALWKFEKDTENSTYINLGVTGVAGGKIVSIMIGGVEHVVTTIVSGGGTDYVMVYNTDTGVKTALPTSDFGTSNYGLQTDGNKIFISGGDEIQSFTLDASLNVTIVDTVSSASSVDIAWDGLYIWCCGSTGSTNFIKQYSSSLVLLDTHQSGSPVGSLCASIKANSNYVAAVYEGGQIGTLGWSILDRTTNIWNDYWGSVTSQTIPESVYPFTGQFWTTVCVEIDVPTAIYITGYSPAMQGKYMEESACPNKSMRLLKLTRVGLKLNNVILKGVAI